MLSRVTWNGSTLFLAFWPISWDFDATTHIQGLRPDDSKNLVILWDVWFSLVVAAQS